MPDGKFYCSVGSNSAHYDVYLAYTYTQSTLDNTSFFTATLKLEQKTDSYDFTANLAPMKIVINNTEFSDKVTVDIDNKGNKGSVFNLYSASMEIPHDSNGNAHVNVRVDCNMYGAGWGPGVVTGESTLYLDQIDRAPPVLSVSASSITARSATIFLSTNENCNIWWYRLEDGVNWTKFSETNARSATTTITGLAPATSYKIQSCAQKTNNHLQSVASVNITTLPEVPGAPTKVTAAGIDSSFFDKNGITISWYGAIDPIKGYEVQAAVKGQNTSVWGGWMPLITFASTSANGSYFDGTHLELNPGDQIKYRVRTTNGSVASGFQESNSLTRLGGVRIHTGAAFQVGIPWVNVTGTWKRASCVWIKTSSVWRPSK